MNMDSNSCGCQIAEDAKIASISARLQIVEKQANATDVKVSKIARIVNPDEWQDKIDSVKRMVMDEESSRESADSSIRQDLVREITERKGKDALIDDAIASEKSSRESEDAALAASISSEASERAAIGERLAEEVSNRSEADTLLNQSISSLAAIVDTDRATLKSDIENVRHDSEQALTSEAEERFLRDKEIGNNLEAEVNRAKAAELEESTLRSAEDSAERESRMREDCIINNKLFCLGGRMKEAERKIEELGGDTLDKMLDVPYSRRVRIADYLYALDYNLTYPKEAKEFFDSDFPPPLGGCSSFRNGNWYGRNYDWLYDESAEFVVRMAANKDRHGSIGVAAAPMTQITDAMVKSGAYSKLMKVVPHMLLDGVNDAGVFANLNVVHRSGREDFDWTGRECCALGAIREILDRFDNAEDAAHWVEHSVYIPVSFIDKTKCSFHFMIGDANSTWIVEDGKAHKLRESDAAAMTNYRLFNNDVYTDGVRANIAAYDPYGAGVERYNLIKDGLAGVTDKDSAAALAKSIWYTRAYPSHPNPPADFWYSEFVNEDEGYSLATPDETLRVYADKFDPYYRSGKRDGTIWKSLHSCVYDLSEKVLRLRVQEIDKEFEFGIVERNTSSGSSLAGKTYIRPSDAKGWYDLLVTVIQQLGGKVVDLA